MRLVGGQIFYYLLFKDCDFYILKDLAHYKATQSFNWFCILDFIYFALRLIDQESVFGF
jgi:hypothetical protein